MKGLSSLGMQLFGTSCFPKCSIFEPCHQAPRMPPQGKRLGIYELVYVQRSCPLDCPPETMRADLRMLLGSTRLWKVGICALLSQVRQVRMQIVDLHLNHGHVNACAWS